jgi:hypothetical protein
MRLLDWEPWIIYSWGGGGGSWNWDYFGHIYTINFILFFIWLKILSIFWYHKIENNTFLQRHPKEMSHYKQFQFTKFIFALCASFDLIIDNLKWKMSFISCNEHKANSIFKFGTHFSILYKKIKFNFSFSHNNINMV